MQTAQEHSVSVNRISKPHSSTTEIVTRGEAQRATDERRAAVNRLIVAAFAGYPTEAPVGDEMGVAVEVWKDALDAAGVPNDQLRAMLTRANIGRASNYPPSVAEIVTCWHSYQADQPTLTYQETEAHSRAALPHGDDGSKGREVWEQLGRRLHEGRGNIVCKCKVQASITQDGADWVCATASCSFAWPTNKTYDAPRGGNAGPLGKDISAAQPEPTPTVKPEPKREYSDAEIIFELADRCEFAVSKVAEDLALGFARYMERAAPLDGWTPVLARGQWGKFMEAREDQAHSAQPVNLTGGKESNGIPRVSTDESS